MNNSLSHPVISDILTKLDSLSPKAQILGNYIIQKPSKAVFMTTRELAETCNISEATVTRFVSTLGYNGYTDFIRALRDFVNTGLTLPDRADLQEGKGKGLEKFHHLVLEELNDLKYLYETIDVKKMEQVVDCIAENKCVYVTGSRLSYTFAYYLGWSLSKIRKGIRILKGSDSTTIDILSSAPDNSLVILIATTRYPNELINLSRLVRRLGHTLVVLTDSSISPVIQFASLSLVVPLKSIPFIGNPSNMLCVIKYIVQALASREGASLQKHQEQLEQIYLENNILFNLKF